MKKYSLEKDKTSKIINSCVEALNQPAGVLLVPTETVYGLVCAWDDKLAIERIYELKGREKGKPLALFVNSVDTLKKFGFALNQNAEKLALKFCPGPLTIVMSTPTGGALGFRIPNHPFVLQLLKKIVLPMKNKLLKLKKSMLSCIINGKR
jgi:L-threonylcarbamoyladenylate synthase